MSICGTSTASCHRRYVIGEMLYCHGSRHERNGDVVWYGEEGVVCGPE